MGIWEVGNVQSGEELMGRPIDFEKYENKRRNRVTTVCLPEMHVNFMNKLVKNGDYTSRSEIVRDALRDWIEKESKLYEVFIKPFLLAKDINTIRVPNGDGTYQVLNRIGVA